MNIKTEFFGKTAVMELVGEFYLTNVRDIEMAWQNIMEKKPKIIGIDCKDLDFIDSSAIGTLVKFLNNSLKIDVKLFFLDINDSIIKIFRTAKLDKILKIKSRIEFEQEYKP